MSESWVKILSTGGASGVLVFAVLFLLKWQSRYMKDAPPAWRRSVILVFLGTWIVIFVAAGLIMYVGVRNEISSQAIIRGRLLGLEPTADFESPFDALYLRRVAKTQSQAAFAWLIVSQAKLSGGRVDLLLDRSTSANEDVAGCELPIKDEFYRREVVLKYDAKNRILSEGGVPLKCGPTLMLDGNNTPRNSPFRFQLIPSAFAQVTDGTNSTRLAAISERLESNDAVVRLQARSDLAASGHDGISYIDGVLKDSKSSYRLRLGTVVALNSMKINDPDLSPIANCAIVQAASSDDETLREQARKYVAQHPKLPLGDRCRQNFFPVNIPPIPEKFKQVKTIYIANDVSIANVDDINDTTFEERKAVSVLEESIGKSRRFTIVRDIQLADIVLKVESYPSEDTLTMYDARHWPTTISIWQMSVKNGLRGKGAPLAAYFEKAFQNTIDNTVRNNNGNR